MTVSEQSIDKVIRSTDTITSAVIAAISDDTDPRLREIMEALVSHLHDFARDVNLNTTEWLEGMNFLVRAGQMSNEKRNEVILVADILGLESVVDTLTFGASGDTTESAVLGPFYREGAPKLPDGASIVQNGSQEQTVLVQGVVYGAEGKPLASATLDIWETAPNGLYEQQDPEQPDMNLRGKFVTGPDGHYSFIGLRPVEYPIPFDGPAGDLLQLMGRHPYRPGHIHFIVNAPGHKKLITQIFDRDASYLDSDAVFAVKDSLLVDFSPAPKNAATDYIVNYDIELASADQA